MLIPVSFNLKINIGYIFHFQAESEKLLLTQNLRESQAIVERSQGDLQAFMARLVQLAAHVDSLQQLCQKADQEFEEHNEV
jgi:protein bicaudal D